MRRAVSSVTVALGLLAAAVGAAGGAVAAPSPAVPEPTPAAGEKACSITDERLRELSGLLATRSGYIVVNDGTLIENRKRIFYLDARCQVTRTVRYSGQGPLDTEDLALSPDGRTLWIADIGDNVTSERRRERVALWSMPVTGEEQPVLHRLAYPERKPHDAEALLIGEDGTPLIVTKTLSGKAEIYAPAAALKTNNTDPVPMRKVGEVTLPRTDTPNVLQGPGRLAITGAARSPDGSKVVLRTYADAFEYDVSDKDVVAALTGGKPRVTPLADPFGEAISYTPDGRRFVTVSDAGELGEDVEVAILTYTPSTRGAPTVADKPAAEAAGRSWTDSLSLDDITYLIAAVGALGAVLVGAGIVGIVRARRRPPAPGDRVAGDLPEPDARDRLPGTPGSRGGDRPPSSAPRRGDGGVYGAPQGGGRPGGGSGHDDAVPPSGGTVYGGAAAAGGGAVYGSGSAGRGSAGSRGSGHGEAGTYGGHGAPRGGYGGSRAEPPRRGAGSGRRDDPERRDRQGGRDPEGYGRGNGRSREYRGTRY